MQCLPACTKGELSNSARRARPAVSRQAQDQTHCVWVVHARQVLSNAQQRRLHGGKVGAACHSTWGHQDWLDVPWYCC